jgi:hypothetical protein
VNGFGFSFCEIFEATGFSSQADRDPSGDSEKGPPPYRLRVGEFDPVESLGKGSDSHLGFYPRQVRTQTEMSAPTKGQVWRQMCR